MYGVMYHRIFMDEKSKKCFDGITFNEFKKQINNFKEKHETISKPNARSVRADTHQLLSYVLLTGVENCGFTFPGNETETKVMQATNDSFLPLSVEPIKYFELVLGNDVTNVSSELSRILP